MLRIYYAYVSGLDPAGDYALSEYRRARLESVRPDASRRCGIGAELLLNRAITDWWSDFPLLLDIVTLEHGKPALRGGEVYIGLSHSARMPPPRYVTRTSGLTYSAVCRGTSRWRAGSLPPMSKNT